MEKSVLVYRGGARGRVAAKGRGRIIAHNISHQLSLNEYHNEFIEYLLEKKKQSEIENSAQPSFAGQAEPLDIEKKMVKFEEKIDKFEEKFDKFNQNIRFFRIIADITVITSK